MSVVFVPPGLSNESWSIMKNMATELCIILIGYFTLVPAIQVTEILLNTDVVQLLNNNNLSRLRSD